MTNIVARLQNGRSRNRGSLFSKAPKPTLGHPQCPIQWVTWALSQEQNVWGTNLPTHPHLVLRLRMSVKYKSVFLFVFMNCTGSNFSLRDKVPIK